MKLIRVSDDGSVLCLHVQGEIRRDDIPKQPDPMPRALGPQGYARKVAVSLEGATYINSSGLAWLLTCQKRFAQAGGKMVIHSVPPIPMDVLQVLGLNRVFHLAPDRADAVAMAQS